MRTTFLRLRFIVLLLALTAAPKAPAQHTALKVEDVLARVRENLTSFRAKVPNVSAEEAVDSKMVQDGKNKKRVTVQSSFRLIRDPQKQQMNERRTAIHLVNEKPYDGKPFSVPYTFGGGFADILSALDSPCIEYQLAPADAASSSSLVLIGASRPASKEPPVCPAYKRDVHVLLEPHTFQVVRFESTLHDLQFHAGLAQRMFTTHTSNHNAMKTIVSYSPVTLGSGTFYLPSKVENALTDLSKPLVLSWEASYSNYHLYAATSTILPEVTLQQAP